MNITTFIGGIAVGTVLVVLFISIIYFIIKAFIKKEYNQSSNLFLPKLINSDSYIEDAMNYLKLTNSLANSSNMTLKRK